MGTFGEIFGGNLGSQGIIIEQTALASDAVVTEDEMFYITTEDGLFYIELEAI